MYSRRLYTANRHAAAAPAANTTNSVGSAAADGTLSAMAVKGRPGAPETALDHQQCWPHRRQRHPVSDGSNVRPGSPKVSVVMQTTARGL